eukprot:GEZU01016440.1.p2 GENE.GEZU01016440.1~~GEZU01016440.1.p2  ORF type:complete len:122 (+),score=22.01 GEZU01016440.1:128-493(+)
MCVSAFSGWARTKNYQVRPMFRMLSETRFVVASITPGNSNKHARSIYLAYMKDRYQSMTKEEFKRAYEIVRECNNEDMRIQLDAHNFQSNNGREPCRHHQTSAERLGPSRRAARVLLSAAT